MSTEADLWRWLSKGGKSFRFDLHMTRIENGCGAGTPDVEGCLDGQHFWIELKCAPWPKTSETVRTKFRPAQAPWHKRRMAAGCNNIWVLMQVGTGHDARRYLVDSRHVDELAAGTTERRLGELAAVHGRSSAAAILLAAASPRTAQR